MCLLPCLCTLAFYRLLLLVVHTVELLTEVAAADFTGNDHCLSDLMKRERTTVSRNMKQITVCREKRCWIRLRLR